MAAQSNEFSVDILAKGALAAVRNVRRLTEDASLLLEAGRAPTAHALAVLALEELGKHIMLVSAGVRMTEPGYPARLTVRLRDHTEKLKQARSELQLPASGGRDLNGALERLEAVAGSGPGGPLP